MTTPRKAGLALLAMLAAMTSVSQFFRASNGVIAPELMRDLALSADVFSIANGSFFIGLGLAQIPVGMLFDRFGPRLTMTGLSLLVVLGALLHAAATSGGHLIAARLLLGAGCGASFMGAVVLCSSWYAGERFATILSWVFALSSIGTFLAATPLAMATELVGWRWTFVASAGVAAAVGLLFYLVVRDDPPGRQVERRHGESFGRIVRGIVEVWHTPGLFHVFAIHSVAYAALATVLYLWAGLYLHDVHGLDGVARGNILLAMMAAQVVGILCYGPMDRIFNTRKGVVLGGAGLSAGLLVLLAALPGQPLAPAVMLLVLLCLVNAYSLVIVAHGRSLFPDHLAGRGVTVVNLAQVVGSAALPILTGAIVAAFPSADGTAPALAYRAVFAAIAGMVLLGLAVYSRSRDAKPRPDPLPRPTE